MREIKFRAWDGEKIVIPDTIDQRIRKGFWKENSCVESSDTLMQFTGLTDKNGKEIYEGDILAIGLDFKVCVTFENGCFQIISNKEQGLSPLVKERAERLKIIGNIYQNPELL